MDSFFFRQGWIPFLLRSLLALLICLVPQLSRATSPLKEAKQIIRVGFYDNSPKFNIGPQEQLGGLFPEILRYIAVKEGWQLEWVQGNWQDCLKRLAAGEIDLMPDVAFSLDRATRYTFTDEPVFLNWATLYTSTGVTVTSIIDLENLRVAVMRGSIHTESREGIKNQVKRFRVNCSFLEFDSYTEVLQAVHNKIADVGVVNRLFGLINANAYDILPTTVMFNPRHIKFAFPPNAPRTPELKTILDRYLKEANTRPDSPIQQILKAFFNGVPSDWRFQSSQINQIHLSREELAWIKKHPVIHLGIDPEFAPFEFMNDHGQYSGFAADYIEILNHRLGLGMKIVPNLSWQEVTRLTQEKKIDVLPAVGFTRERTEYLKFSTPYVGFHRVIISHLDTPFISDLKDAESLRVAVQANSSHSGWLKDNSSIVPVEYDTLAQTLQAVATKKADAMIGNLAVCTYLIRKLNITNLKIAAPVSSQRHLLHFGIRKDWPLLVSIINKGLDSISDDEAEMIRNRWTAAGYNIGIPAGIMWKSIGLILAGAVLLVGAFLTWSFQLKREVRRRKLAEKKLQTAHDELEKQIEKRTQDLATTHKTLQEELKQKLHLEKQLHRSQKMETIGLMAGGVAHDLNNILTGMISYPDLLLMKLPEESDLRPMVKEIQSSGKRAGEVAADLLTIARGSVENRTITTLNELIKEYLCSLEHKKTLQLHKHVTVLTRLEPGLMNISCSPVHIRKCIMNLVNNGAEAITGEGEILLATHNLYSDRACRTHDSLLAQDYVVLSIQDSGPGIDKAHINRIFEPFYTKKVMGNRSGSGLGLTVVWNTVHDHGGVIDLDSDESGTRFTLYFPATREAIPADESIIPLEDLKGNGERILVVDDEESQRFIVSELLELLNYQYVALSSGEEAIAYLGDKSVDLILMDMSMGPGLNGLEAYQQILKIRPDQKAIVTSGLATSDDIQQMLKLGAGYHLSKPFSIEAFGVAIKTVLRT